jgi:hypothetical protein
LQRTAAFVGGDRATWAIKPDQYIDPDSIIADWDDVLRLVATIKLKESTVSDIFRRLNPAASPSPVCCPAFFLKHRERRMLRNEESRVTPSAAPAALPASVGREEPAPVAPVRLQGRMTPNGYQAENSAPNLMRSPDGSTSN